MNILFTGGSSGFGQYVAEKLRAQGHRVFTVGIGPNSDHETDFSVLSYGETVVIFDKAIRSMGSVDCLVNNAGTTEIAFIDAHTACQFERVLRVNLQVPFYFCSLFVGANRRRPRLHRIINTSSMGAVVALRGSPGYCASKAGIEAMTKVLAKELADPKTIDRWCCLCIAPGTVFGTKMMDYVIEKLQTERGMTHDEAVKYAVSTSPLGRPCTHEEVWRLFNFAINEAPEYMSGSVIRMPGAAGV